MLSAQPPEDASVRSLGLGAADFIRKPFRVRELSARVNAVYRRTSMNQTAPTLPPPVVAPMGSAVDFEFDDYQLSITSRRLWHKDNGEIVLTTAEFDLLHALLRRRGQVLDRDQLLNAIKGREWESYDRAIDGLISD